MKVFRFAALVVAGLVCLGACDEDDPPPVASSGDAGEASPPGADAGVPGDAAGAEDAAADAQSCSSGPTTFERINITGKILLNGQPHSGFARLRDRRTGSLGAEASVNDAGFFLLGATVEEPAECEDWWIEIENSKGKTPEFSGELDANALVRETLASGERDVDISSKPIAVE